MAKSVHDAVHERRSIKEFMEEEVSRMDIEELLELAILAPNHRMTHPFGFVVLGPVAREAYGVVKGDRRAAKIDDAGIAEKVRDQTVEDTVAVPVIIGFTQRLDDDPEIREEDYATLYMGIQTLLLAALDRGLGTHVKTGAVLEDARTRDALGIEEGHRLVALVHLGRPAAIPEPKPRPKARDRTRWLP